MKKYAAIIFATEPEAIDIMIDKFRNTFDVNIIFFKTSYDKLWITAEPKPDGGLKDGSIKNTI